MSVLLLSMGASPIGEQVRWHFGIGTGGGGPRRGKRLRPRLLFNAAFEEGGTFEEAVDAAVAIEVLHNYSLVHDDIEDGDKLRHGTETVWARYGIAHGVNAGDSMCAVSYLALLRNTATLPPHRIVAMMQVLHQANLGMCAGQGYDIGFETAAHVTREEYLAMIDGKTAALFGASCELGARAAGCSDERGAAYGELGRCYGRAFQIRDDVLGTWGAPEETGKPSGSDIARRKWSFPVVWALSAEPSAARDAIERRYALRTPMEGADVRAIVEALDALGAREAADEAVDAQLRDAEDIAERYQIDRGHTVRTLFTRSARRVA
ncbi:MAG: polyprenyl synthetase family protein [Candidatus Eremiobacteraeota bacterium]|nr:polyprenyl synthetase family protein [Candidatus Eremiobacteraeota bacterium]MBV8721910.1 polyprenyl synthetase family protein [Candidatus Eremiobacteraeota bacterium]